MYHFWYCIKFLNSFGWLLILTDCNFTSAAAFKASNLFAKHDSSGHMTPVACIQTTCKGMTQVWAIVFPFHLQLLLFFSLQPSYFNVGKNKQTKHTMTTNPKPTSTQEKEKKKTRSRNLLNLKPKNYFFTFFSQLLIINQPHWCL